MSFFDKINDGLIINTVKKLLQRVPIVPYMVPFLPTKLPDMRDKFSYKLNNSLTVSNKTRSPAVAGMADRTAPVVKLTRQKIVIPSAIGLAAVLTVGQLCLSL